MKFPEDVYNECNKVFYSLVSKVKTIGETFIIYHTVAFPLEMCDGEKLQIQPIEGFIVNLSEYGWNNPTFFIFESKHSCPG